MFSFTLYFWSSTHISEPFFLVYQKFQQKDRTEEIRSIVENYAGSPFEFIPLRLEDAFDPEWWVRIGRASLSESARSLGLDMTDEG